MGRRRVVIAGLGDTGLLTAIHLAEHAEVVGISAQPALVRGRDVGIRVCRPDEWAREYWIAFERFRALDRVRVVHGLLTAADLTGNAVTVREADGTVRAEEYDALVISTGVANGFWRQPGLRSADSVGEELRALHEQVAAAPSVAIVGGGAAAVGSAATFAATWPDKRVDLYFPGSGALASHHPQVWSQVERRLADAGVGLHPGHRAVVPEGFGCDRITTQPVRWSTGQPDTTADAVLWAIGQVTPNTAWLPAEVLDQDRFVRVTPQLQVPGHPRVFAVGDVAATDPLRGSARNRGDALVAHNIRAEFDGKPKRDFTPPAHRWGSVLGAQADGLEIFAANGRAFRIPLWTNKLIMQPLIQRRGIYHGVRKQPRGVSRRPAE